MTSFLSFTRCRVVTISLTLRVMTAVDIRNGKGRSATFFSAKFTEG